MRTIRVAWFFHFMTTLAWAEVLLTLDRSDFAGLLESTFYGLHVLLPYAFLQREREAGNL